MRTLVVVLAIAVVAGGTIYCRSNNSDSDARLLINGDGYVVSTDSVEETDGSNLVEPMPFSGSEVAEHVVIDFGKRTIRTDADATVSMPQLVKNKQNCFIIMSKKDYYLYVYEAQGADTVLVARYDCCFALRKGQKRVTGDMSTPHCTMKTPFTISQIANASSWCHDFGDGRGSIPSYGDFFLRLKLTGPAASNRSIGIHGSTNNRESVPGRASEGCIRLKDEDIRDLRNNYAFVGMKVVIKEENVDDLPFEIRAMQKQKVERKRHFDPRTTLTNEQIATAPAEQGRSRSMRPKTQTAQPAVDSQKPQPVAKPQSAPQ